jgi:uncharacterized OsmC-like protein/fermentation-respiration switch protein FrsA (DUF1100 family)
LADKEGLDDMELHFLRLTFKNDKGHTLAARLDFPADEKPAAYAIFAHCFTCTKNLNAIVHINQALARQGIATLRFDFTGLGDSEGDFAATSFASNVSDLVAAAEYLKQAFDAPKLLIGHSLGGAAVLHAARHISSVLAVTTIGAPADLSHLARLLEPSRPSLETLGEAEITLAGKTFRVRKPFLDDLEATNMVEAVRNLNRPLLILHSPQDAVVTFENATNLFAMANHPKSLISLDGAGHLLSDRADSLYAGAMLATWAAKVVNPPDPAKAQRDPSDNRILVRTGKTGYQTEIIANGHALIADEPIAAGGADTGPSPYDYLSAALGACTSMTLRMYADRKAWPLEAAVVRLRHRKIHADECRECETATGKIDVIEREVDPQGPLSEEQRQRLLEIADRCPVHRTLHSEIVVRTTLKA